MVIGIVAGGVVGDADDAGAFLCGELIQLLAEVNIGCAFDAVGAFTQVDGVEIPGDDLLFGVVLFKIERFEDLHQFPADCDVLLAGQIFNELLRQGGAAVPGAADEHIGTRRQSAHPVHTVVFPEALILDGDGRVDHIRRDLLVVDPDAVFAGKELSDLLVLPCLRIFGQDEGGLVELDAVQIVMGDGLDILIDVGQSLFVDADCGDAADDAEKQADHQQCRDHAPKNMNDHPGQRPLPGIRDFFPFDRFFLFHAFSSTQQSRGELGVFLQWVLGPKISTYNIQHLPMVCQIECPYPG